MVSKILRADGVTELASINSVTYHESVNADIDLRPGCVASNYIEVTCFGQQSDAPDVGEALTYYQVVGETETLIGIFYAEPSIPTKNSYSFIAYDAVHKLDADVSSWLSANQENFPYTVKQLVEQACTIAGVTLGTSSWTFNTMSVNAFYADGITCRNILQYAAEIACKFVRCNTSGEIVFDWYNNLSKNFLPIDDVSLERTNNRTKMVTLDEVIPSGTYVFSWSYSGTSAATTFAFRKQSGSDNIVTVRVDQSSPQTITLSDDCYRIYAYISTNQASGATAEISDITLKNPVQYRIYPTTGTFNGEECYAYKQDGLTYDNYDTSVLARVAVHPVGEDDVAYYYPTGVTSGNTLDITNNALLYGASAADMSGIAQTVYDGITAVGQYRPMDVNMFPNECPFRSGQIVPVTDAQGVSFTTVIMSKVATDSAVTLASTGREVYGEYAMDTAKKLIQLAADIVQINKLKVDWAEIGTAIINTLEANGINADWINTGVLTVKDANDRVLFSADINNHTVSIAGLIAESYYGDSLRLFKEVYASSDGASFSIKPPSSTDRSSLITMARYFANRELSQIFAFHDYSDRGLIGYTKITVDPVMGDITYSTYSIEFQNGGIYFKTDNTGTGTTLLRLSDSYVMLGLPDKWRSALGLGTAGVLPITIDQGGTGATTRADGQANFGYYTSVAQLNLTSSATMADIASAMPNGSVAVLNTNDFDATTGIVTPDGAAISLVTIYRINSNRIFAIGARSYANVATANARLYYAAWNGTAFIGWRKVLLADQTALAIGDGGTGQTGVTSTTTVSDIISAASGLSIVSATYTQWGKIAQINVVVKKTAAVTTATDITLGTLVSGKRPSVACGAICSSSTISHSYITTSGSVVANGTWAANTQKTIMATYILA